MFPRLFVDLHCTVENDQNETHAKRIAEFAIEAVKAASKVLIDEDDPEAGYVRIRVGCILVQLSVM